jgi:DNA-binding response OmpR family regulator
MITLIVTADRTLYDRLSGAVHTKGDSFQLASNALDGLKLALGQDIDRIIVDMSLHATDTLIETLHSKKETAHIPIYVIPSRRQLPLELRRLCTDVLEADVL